MGFDPDRPLVREPGGTEESPPISRHRSTGSRGAGFERFDLRPELRRAIVDAAYTEPRPIQLEAIPPALKGRDVLGLAQTGTGKTAAFVLPILQRLLKQQRSGPRALVLTPTRELAAQVHSEFERLAQHTRLASAAVFGGVPIPRQTRTLRRRPEVVVACPGRLLDLLDRGVLRLNAVEVLVLDEADHMFDMGFLPDVRRILKTLPRKRQNLLFSATMPREIRKLADSVLSKPAVVELAHSQPAETIAQALYSVSEGQKIFALERLLAASDFRSAIVFLRTKRRARNLAQKLDKAGHHAVALQGNMSQSQRNRALEGFREGRYDVLVATDIAARGLDIAGVSHVVNFDVPNTPDAYTHRVGRTGRSGLSGTAYTFATPADAVTLRAIEKRVGQPIPRGDNDELGLRSAPTRKQTGAQRTSKQKATRRAAKPGAKQPTKSSSKQGVKRRSKQGAPGAAKQGPKRQGSKTLQAQTPARRGASSKLGGKPAAAFGEGVIEAQSPRRDRARSTTSSSRKRRSRRSPRTAKIEA